MPIRDAKLFKFTRNELHIRAVRGEFDFHLIRKYAYKINIDAYAQGKAENCRIAELSGNLDEFQFQRVCPLLESAHRTISEGAQNVLRDTKMASDKSVSNPPVDVIKKSCVRRLIWVTHLVFFLLIYFPFIYFLITSAVFLGLSRIGEKIKNKKTP